MNLELLNKLKKINSSKADLFKNKFELFLNILLQENEKYNLTAITKPDEIYIKHFLDSLESESILKNNASVLDIGSGAGFPSVPLAIVRDDLKFTLVDSLKKRVDFLNNTSEKLELKYVHAIHSRAEDLINRESYDYCLARAVAPLNILCEYCLPFVKIGGKFIAYKSEKTDDEIKEAETALKILGGRINKIKNYTLKIESEEFLRTLIVIEKIAVSPNKYPRKGNKPRSEPLKERSSK